MYHLPAYVALARLVLARRVVVVLPSSLEGPRCLARAGAREVLVVGDGLTSEDGIVVRPGSTQLPLRDRSVDVVCCVEALGGLARRDRRELLTEAHRVLRPDGLLATWIEQPGAQAFGQRLPGSEAVDFWTLEEELATLFEEVAILAQMPWQGFSVAPVVDEEQSSQPGLALDEGLLSEAPEASHYLAIAGKSTLPSSLARDCVLIPVPTGGAESRAGARDLTEQVEGLEDEVDRLREELSLRAAKSAAAQSRVRELEGQLESLRARAGEVRADEVDAIRRELADAEKQLEDARLRENEEHGALASLEERQTALVAEHAELTERHRELQAQRDQLVAELGELARDGEGSRERVEGLHARIDAQREELDAQKSLLRSRETDLAILSRTVEDQEKALERANESLTERKRELERARAAESELRSKFDALKAEREELRRQVDVSMAEREGARQLAARVEAQLEVATRKLSEREDTLAAKIEEASRLEAEAAAMRQRLEDQQAQLAHTQEKAEELSVKAAQGQMLSEVALDRDRLRDELTNRQKQISALEERLWDARDGLQKEKIEVVRLAGEVDRMREQLERSRAVEQERNADVERQATELRALEVERADLKARLEARTERIAQLEEEATRRVGATDEAKLLNEDLQKRGTEVARLKEQLAQVELRRQEAVTHAGKREEELRLAGERLVQLQRNADDQARLAATLQAEIDVRTVELEQAAATIGNLQSQIAEYRGTITADGQKATELQRQLEQSASEQQGLRQRLREREQALEDLSATRETDTLELFKLRQGLEQASQTIERLERDLVERAEAARGEEPSDWPDAAVAEIRRLEDELAAQGRRHAEELTRQELEHMRSSGDSARSHRLQLEATVRATEQEHMLGLLDSAEQKIWEMTDASDRNAARFEASLANLEKHKEEIDGLGEELEVTRNLLAAEQARSVELERLLASERAKMARAGLGLEGFPRSDGDDDPFADLDRDMLDLGEIGAEAGAPRKQAFELDSELVRLSDVEDSPQPIRPEPGAVVSTVHDRSGSLATGVAGEGADRAPNRARIYVEAVADDEDDDEWPEDG